MGLSAYVTRSMYQRLAKPLLFRRDPETVHDRTVHKSVVVAKIAPLRALLRWLWAYRHQALRQRICGVEFANPIGLAGGFDKNAELTGFMPSLGFGFAEVGSITALPCPGNTGTRLWRLPKSKSLLVYYGLKNDGVEVISRRLKDRRFQIPVGTNIAKTNNRDSADDRGAIADYAVSFRTLADIGDYFTINISCPNTYGGQPFVEKERLDALLGELDTIPTRKPVFVKLSPDITKQQRADIAELAAMHRVDGFICSNLTKVRTNSHIRDALPSENGGMSGAIVRDLSNELIADMYRLTRGTKVIIGCGGVFTAKDAYEKIQLGASLIQMVTGLIYEGPQVVGDINRGLVKLLQADGYANVAAAVGVSNRGW